jgi:hypothetical protein
MTRASGVSAAHDLGYGFGWRLMLGAITPCRPDVNRTIHVGIGGDGPHVSCHVRATGEPLEEVRNRRLRQRDQGDGAELKIFPANS